MAYLRFKDHKKCSQMIANALDSDSKFTASLISRKLKQLGLLVPRKKKLKTSMILRDEDLGDFSMEKLHESDDETLLALRNGYVLVIYNVYSVTKFFFFNDWIFLINVIEARRGARLSLI